MQFAYLVTSEYTIRMKSLRPVSGHDDHKIYGSTSYNTVYSLVWWLNQKTQKLNTQNGILHKNAGVVCSLAHSGSAIWHQNCKNYYPICDRSIRQQKLGRKLSYQHIEIYMHWASAARKAHPSSMTTIIMYMGVIVAAAACTRRIIWQPPHIWEAQKKKNEKSLYTHTSNEEESVSRVRPCINIFFIPVIYYYIIIMLFGGGKKAARIRRKSVTRPKMKYPHTLDHTIHSHIHPHFYHIILQFMHIILSYTCNACLHISLIHAKNILFFFCWFFLRCPSSNFFTVFFFLFVVRHHRAARYSCGMFDIQIMLSVNFLYFVVTVSVCWNYIFFSLLLHGGCLFCPLYIRLTEMHIIHCNLWVVMHKMLW